MGQRLVPAERRVAALGPLPRVVGVAAGTTDVVDALDRLFGGLMEAVEVAELVPGPGRTALL